MVPSGDLVHSPLVMEGRMTEEIWGEKEVKSMKVCSAYGGHEVKVKLYCEKGNCC